MLALGSFSKILAPGLRLGWIQTAPERLQALARSGVLQSGGGLNPFTSAVVQSAIEMGLQEEHLKRLIGVYAQRAKVMMTAVENHLGDLAVFNEPRGGFFVWLWLPASMDAKRLRSKAKRRRVNFQPGIHFSSSGGLKNGMRLCFVHYDGRLLEEGIKRLSGILA